MWFLAIQRLGLSGYTVNKPIIRPVEGGQNECSAIVSIIITAVRAIFHCNGLVSLGCFGVDNSTSFDDVADNVLIVAKLIDQMLPPAAQNSSANNLIGIFILTENKSDRTLKSVYCYSILCSYIFLSCDIFLAFRGSCGLVQINNNNNK